LLAKFINKFFSKSLKNIIPFFKKIFYNFNAEPIILGLKIKLNTPLAEKNDIIFLPFDKYITWWVIKEGYYKHFILNELNTLNEEFIFIDIGANVGLVSKQVKKLKGNLVDIYCYEPNYTNYKCLSFNLNNHAKIFNFGLGDNDSEQKMFNLMKIMKVS